MVTVRWREKMQMREQREAATRLRGYRYTPLIPAYIADNLPRFSAQWVQQLYNRWLVSFEYRLLREHDAVWRERDYPRFIATWNTTPGSYLWTSIYHNNGHDYTSDPAVVVQERRRLQIVWEGIIMGQQDSDNESIDSTESGSSGSGSSMLQPPQPQRLITNPQGPDAWNHAVLKCILEANDDELRALIGDEDPGTRDILMDVVDHDQKTILDTIRITRDAQGHWRPTAPRATYNWVELQMLYQFGATEVLSDEEWVRRLAAAEARLNAEGWIPATTLEQEAPWRDGLTTALLHHPASSVLSPLPSPLLPGALPLPPTAEGSANGSSLSASTESGGSETSDK